MRQHIRNRETAKYGPLRTKLAEKLKPILNDYKDLNWFLDSGTLLGAHRDGTMLLHDDDFDLGFYLPEKDVEYMEKLCEHLIEKGFNARTVHTYATKIEIFDPEYGKYKLQNRIGNPDFHNVTIDLTMYVKTDFKNITFLHEFTEKCEISIPLDSLFPLTDIEYEKSVWPAPNKTEEFLTSVYGYIGTNAIFNPKTCKYEKKTGDVTIFD